MTDQASDALNPRAVPREPTEAMIEAGESIDIGEGDDIRPLWRAMYDAYVLPAAPAEAGTDDALIAAIKDYRQADEDGVMVLVSRQACDEAAARIAAQAERVAELELERDQQKRIVSAACSNARVHESAAKYARAEQDKRAAWLAQFVIAKWNGTDDLPEWVRRSAQYWTTLTNECEQAEARAEANAKDAARWQHLRANASTTGDTWEVSMWTGGYDAKRLWCVGSQLDERIDAAIANKERQS